jgi:hypothetical protein
MFGSEIVASARLILQDQTAVRWSDAEMAAWITEGCRYIALRRPDAAAVNQAATLTAGPKQSIAAMSPAGMRVLDVVRNLTTGRAMRLVNREALDAHAPTWYSGAQAQPSSWCHDNRDPKTFYVYPPAPSGAQVEIVYSRDVVTITSGNLGSQALTIDDIWAPALLNYVLYRCYGKDADDASNAGLAAGYLAACDGALAVKQQADVGFSPPMNAPGAQPAPGIAAGGV